MKDINGIEIKEGDNVEAFLVYQRSYGRTGTYYCTGIVVRHGGRLKLNDNGNMTRIEKFRDQFSKKSQIRILKPE